MPDLAYVIRASVYALMALLYAYVGIVIMRRHTSADTRTANILFAFFWHGLAATWAIMVLFYVALITGAYLEWIGLLGLEAMVISIFVAIWGLLFYLVFLYTGESRWLIPLTVSYALFTAFCIALVAWRSPTALTPTAFGFSFEYARDPPGWVLLATNLLVSGPIVGAAVAYGSLYGKTEARAQKLRIALVASSFALWFGWGVVKSSFGLVTAFEDSLAFTAIDQCVPIIVPLIVLAAYRPPAWLRARTGLTIPGSAQEQA